MVFLEVKFYILQSFEDEILFLSESIQIEIMLIKINDGFEEVLFIY